MWKKVIKNNFRILKKTHAYLQTILKAPVRFQKDRTKTVGGVTGTRYLQKIRNHAPRATHHTPRKAKKQCPFAFLRKAGDKKNHQNIHAKTYNDRNSKKKVREKSRECHNHKPQPFPDPKRKRKPTNPNKHKPNKRTKSTKISSLFLKRRNRNTKRTEKHKNKMTHGKTYNKSPCRINHKATKSKTNTGITALERSVEQTTGGFKALLQLATFTLGPDATLNTETHKNSVRIKAHNSVNASKRKHKNQNNHCSKQRRVLMANSTVCQSK